MKLQTLLLIAGLVSTGSIATGQEATPDARAALRVMSFNIRYGTAKDGKNHWDKRKELVAETIREFEPDLLGTQETMHFQSEFLQEEFPDYTAFGRTRKKSGEGGEQCTIFYRTERFSKLGGCHLWLSETPNKPGSKSWDSSLPRMVTWLCLRDATNPDRPICIMSTHFDHRGGKARKMSARLVATRGPEIAKSHWDARLIVTGDFNSGEGSKPYKEMFSDASDSLVDTYRATHEERGDHEGTFNGFQGTDDKERIDWIFADPRWEIESAEIVRKNDDGQYPSDHFPVTAVLKDGE